MSTAKSQLRAHLPTVAQVVGDLRAIADRLQDLATILDAASSDVQSARITLDIARQLRLVNQQRVAVPMLDKARGMAKSDKKLKEELDTEYTAQNQELIIQRQLRMTWSRLPASALRRVCELGPRDLVLVVSRVCSTWRKQALTCNSLWREVVVTTKDHSPHHKAAAYTKRSGSHGLRVVDLDMSFDFNNPPKHPKRVSARNEQKSTLQCILHAIDKETKQGVVHNLDYFRFFTKFQWHGLDICYILRFLIRPYIQPVKIRIESADYTTNLADLAFRLFPLLPAFNPRLVEVEAKGRPKIRYRFAPAEGPLGARITELKACQVSRDIGGGWGDENSNIKFLVHGLYAAATSRTEYVSPFREGAPDLTYEACAPGQGDLAAHRAEAIPRGWTTVDQYDRSDPVTGPRISLPNLHTLVVGAKDLGFLTRLDAPRLEKLGVGTPPWLGWKRLRDAREGDEAHVKLMTALRNFGGSLKTLDLRNIHLKAYPFMGAVLHELCPHLEHLNLGLEDEFRAGIIAYITAKRDSDVGTRRLKSIDVSGLRWTVDERQFLKENVDELQRPTAEDRQGEWELDMDIDTYCAYLDNDE
ncbi:hypothetical protein EXIGLDRAFT_830536 [Exidia glandulosa HHB12029]|uniref:F-box domain-containing protein n=1 Tax=Exidia glandulosa HHB12029 TaxID=1314781 RepID=A0A165NEN5_EXIGL|nr:hypothetical protein EXIGLDRAFT_830536 [Exidia glandulosa HHB12029]